MELIVENINGKNVTFLRGIMSEANFGIVNGFDYSTRGRNRNGRYYHFNILKEAVLKLKEKVDNGSVLAYRNHPSHSDLIYEDSCSLIRELNWDDKTGRAYCKVEIIENIKDGKKVLEDIKNGINYGISTRATGSLNENKEVTSLELITADLIPIIKENGYYTSIQSCVSCELSLTESIQEYYTDFLIEDKVPCGCIYATLDNENKKIAENYLIESFKKCLMQI